ESSAFAASVVLLSRLVSNHRRVSFRPSRLATAFASAASNPPLCLPLWNDQGGTLASRHTLSASSAFADALAANASNASASAAVDLRVTAFLSIGYRPRAP